MKIAVTASEPSLDSPVDPRFGRASHFIVVDLDTGTHEVVANTQNVQAAQGAGVQAAATVAQLGVDAVLTGHCGPKAFRGLSMAGVTVYAGVGGDVRDAVARFKNKEFKPLDGPDTEGHWT